MSATDRAPLRLKPREDRRLRAGHLWVYSNEVDTQATPLTALAPGDPVDIIAASGRWLGWGYANPHTLLAARVLGRERSGRLDPAWLEARIRQALALRVRRYEGTAYRLVFGESDGLPGLVVDRYGAVLVVQITTAGMERVRELVFDALEAVLAPAAIVVRGDSGLRALEHLDETSGVVRGKLAEPVVIEEHGVRHAIDVLHGQKTGWFFDQRDNRAAMLPYARDARVLDVCSYIGAWGLGLAQAGAREALLVDSSAVALGQARVGAAANGLDERVSFVQSDAFDALQSFAADGQSFDIVVLDPPAFIKRRKDAKAGTAAYARLAQAGLRVLVPGGILVNCSCSYHLPADELLALTQNAAQRAERTLQCIHRGGQGADHPVHPAMPETAYLKCFALRALDLA